MYQLLIAFIGGTILGSAECLYFSLKIEILTDAFILYYLLWRIVLVLRSVTSFQLKKKNCEEIRCNFDIYVYICIVQEHNISFLYMTLRNIL